IPDITPARRSRAARAPAPRGAGQEPALHAMLEARSVAVVGASPRPGTFGHRMVAEVARSPAARAMYLLNPKYPGIGGGPRPPPPAAPRHAAGRVRPRMPAPAPPRATGRGAAR